MHKLLLVGAGGFVGAVGRYLVAGWMQRLSSRGIFPVGTLSVNLLGCFVIGLLFGLVERAQMLGPQSRLFLLVGLVGSFTTFSTFSQETVTLFREGEGVGALVNVALHLVIGLLAVLVGDVVSSAL